MERSATAAPGRQATSAAVRPLRPRRPFGAALSGVAWSRLAEVDDAGRVAVLTRIVAASCAGALGIGRDAVDVDRPLHALGLDPRMLVGFRTEVEVMLGTDLWSPGLLGTCTIREIACDLALQLGD